MIITCPRCATRYLLEAGVVRPPGRQVRCARCQHTWFQDPQPDLPTPIPVPVEEPAHAGPVTDRSRMLPAPPGSVAQPVPRFEIPPPPPIATSPVVDRQRARSRSLAGLSILLAFLAGFVLLFLYMPNEIAQVWPESASLYDALGMPVNTRGFKIIASHTQELDKTVPVIAIKGQIINETDRELPVPKVRLAVRDQAGKEIYHWTVLADQQRLGPHEQGTFSARLESPPAEAADLEVRFARSGE